MIRGLISACFLGSSAAALHADMLWISDFSNEQLIGFDIESDSVTTQLDAIRPVGIVADPVEQTLYWIGNSPGSARGVWKLPLDTGVSTRLVESDPQQDLLGITLDIPTGILFWNSFQGDVYRSDLFGNATPLFFVPSLQDIAVDPIARRLFVSSSDLSSGPNGSVIRAAYDGTQLNTVVSGIRRGPVGLTVDAVDQRLFFGSNNPVQGEFGQLSVFSVAQQALKSLADDVDVNDVVLAPQRDWIYFSAVSESTGTSQVLRVRTDGTELTQLSIANLGQVGGLTIMVDPLLGDATNDGCVDLTDVSVVVGAFGSCTADPMYQRGADSDRSGCIDLQDLSDTLAQFGACN